MATSPIYDSMDEIGRLMMSIEKMNLNNSSPIFGVADAAELSFADAVRFAEVSAFAGGSVKGTARTKLRTPAQHGRPPPSLSLPLPLSLSPPLPPQGHTPMCSTERLPYPLVPYPPLPPSLFPFAASAG